MLNVGDSAPDFTLLDHSGRSVKLSDYFDHSIVLYFYPKDDTPGCTREAIGFSTQKAKFEEKNAIVFGVSKDSVDSHLKFCDKHQLQLPLLSDPEKTVISAYDVWKEKTLYGKVSFGIVRSTFLIKKGKIAKIWTNVKVDGHVDAVLEAL